MLVNISKDIFKRFLLKAAEKAELKPQTISIRDTYHCCDE